MKFSIKMFTLLGILVCLWGGASIQAANEEPLNWYAVDSNLLSEIRDRISEAEENEDADALESWRLILDGLYGKASIKQALKKATAKTKNGESDILLWNKIASALEIVRDLQLFEYDYNIDPELVLVIQNMVNENSSKGKKGKERIWNNVLMAMMGEGNLKKAIKKLKSLKKKDRPEEFNRLIDALEGYESKSAAAAGYAVANSAYNYDLYDSETGTKLYTLEFDSDTKQGTSGNYNSKNGKMQWDVQFAGGEKKSNYLSYGYWASSKANGGKDKTYNRERVAFYHGDNPATDIDQVRGAALYRGDAVGVWHKNTTKSKEMNGFTGEVELIANFEEGNVSGQIKNLSDSNMPIDKIYLGTAEFDSNAQFSGETATFNNGHRVGQERGTYQGGFFNQENPTDAPGELGGTFSASTGEDVSDINVHGAFGTSVVHHDDTYGQ